MPGLMDSDYNASVAGRKAAFVRTMKNHPERLKGKTIEEAYKGMRQNVANTHKPHASASYNGPRGNTLGPNVPASYKGQTRATAGPKASSNGQDTATASPRSNKAVGTGLLGGPKAKMSAAPTQGAVERRLNKSSSRGPYGTPKPGMPSGKSGYGQSVGKSASTVGKEIKKVAGSLTKRRHFDL